MRWLVVTFLFLFSLVQANTASAQGNAQAGKTLWEDVALSRCSYCHGVKGEGGFGPDLAGRQLSLEQFKRAVRKPWGVMPTFVENQVSDQDLANFQAYLTSLTKVAEPGAWRTPLSDNMPAGQKLVVAAVGCGQCHGPLMANPRMDAGAVAADFEWFKKMVYEHTTAMPAHRKVMGEPDGLNRMGNYSRTRLPEPFLEEIWKYMRDELKFRVLISSTLKPASSAGTYDLLVENEGLAGKGLTAEDMTITLVLAPGTKVTNATGNGYQGVRNDPQAKADVAVWQLSRLAPKGEQRYTITLGTGKVASGQVRWNKPALGTPGPDQVNVTMPAPSR